jgi:hypothetical protein
MTTEERNHRSVSLALQPPINTSIMGVPKETIEDMMRAWTKIMIQTLKAEGERPLGDRNLDVELGNMQPQESQPQYQASETDSIEVDDVRWLEQPVEVWSQHKIQEEESRRLEIPSDYFELQGLGAYQHSYVPDDLWAPYWIGTDESASSNGFPQLWHGTVTDKMKYQNRLVLAMRLTSGSDWPGSTWCRVKLIGSRLRTLMVHLATRGELYCSPMYRAERRALLDRFRLKEQSYVEILLEYLWQPAEFKITVKSLLEKCYEKGILHQNYEPVHTSELVHHIGIIILAVSTMDIFGDIFRGNIEDTYNEWLIRFFENPDYMLQRFIKCNSGDPSDPTFEGTEELAYHLRPAPIGTDVGQLRHAIRNDTELLGQVEELHFRPEDLRIALLKSVGRIKIVWIDQISNHLRLSSTSSEFILSIWWFSFYTSIE